MVDGQLHEIQLTAQSCWRSLDLFLLHHFIQSDLLTSVLAKLPAHPTRSGSPKVLSLLPALGVRYDRKNTSRTSDLVIRKIKAQRPDIPYKRHCLWNTSLRLPDGFGDACLAPIISRQVPDSMSRLRGTGQRSHH